MYITEIELNNFRIYKGTNRINLTPDGDKNIIIISGKNGFGKTTFLMSLVWCLYGKNMQNVDELYHKEIQEKGGYAKYITNSLNRLAAKEGETRFSVSITFKDVKIPEISCNEIKVTRYYDTVTSASDRVEVLVDGFANQLIEDLTTEGKNDGEEIFIRDFILPIEIAKFFFFDAEKIVALAQSSSPIDQRKQLSIAYTEVLGIKKYEDMKLQLEGIQDEYRKKSAKPQDKAELSQTLADIQKTQIQIDSETQAIADLEEQKSDFETQSAEIQRKLIQEGNLMTLEQLQTLRDEEESYSTRLIGLQEELKELYDLIPFGLAGEQLLEVVNQLQAEKKVRELTLKQEDVEDKTTAILNELDQRRIEDLKTSVHVDIRNFYERQISELIKKHFYSNLEALPEGINTLHDFTDAMSNELITLAANLKQSFRTNFTRLSDEYNKTKNLVESVRRKIRDAEKDSEDEHIQHLRTEKARFDMEKQRIEHDIFDKHEKIGGYKNELKTLRQRHEELRKRIDDSTQYSAKEQKTQQIIDRLKDFIKTFKEEKKKSLEENILAELQLLLHKKGFVKKVVVDINQNGDDVDINLYNARGEKIDKGSLSMGEKQMYASALLKALVNESEIDFPVFIDSPMQKFDKDHAQNVIKEFYPNVSGQVIIFPLIHKELTESEFELMKPNVCKAYLINNQNSDSSNFQESEPAKLIQTYNATYAD